MQTEKSSEKSSGWGGARNNSGRKKTTSKSIALRIPEDVEAILDSVEGSKSAYIVEAIRFYHNAVRSNQADRDRIAQDTSSR